MGSLGDVEAAKKKAIWLYPKVLGFNPSERWGHSSCYSHGVLYIFGGCCGGKHFDDVLALNLTTMSWTTLVTCGHGPGPRDSHSVVLVARKMIVFGGTNGNKKVNDVHILDLDSKEWMKPECKGVPPSPRESHTATLVGEDKMVIFGGSGEGEANYLNDLHVLDIGMMTWGTLETKGDFPVARDSHSALAIQKRVFFYGGDCGDRYHGDVDVLDMDTMTWSRLVVRGQSPGVRAGHASVAIGTKIYVIGGVGDKRYYNDVWVLDVTTSSWSRLEICGQQPQGRFSHTAIVTDTDIAIYGGCGEDERPLDEFLVLHLGSEHPNGRYNISMCKMFGNHRSQGKPQFLKEPENQRAKTMMYTNNVEVNPRENLRYKLDTLHPKRRRTSNSKVLDIESEQEEHSLSLSQHSSPSQSDQEQTPSRTNSDPVKASRLFSMFKNHNNVANMLQRTTVDPNFFGEHRNQSFPKQFVRVVEPPKTLEPGSLQNMIGADVRGKVDAAFDSGYLMTATVNGKIFRGVLFPPANGAITRGLIQDPNSSSSSNHIGVSRPYPNSNHADTPFFKHSMQPISFSVPEPGHITRPSPAIRTNSSLNRELKSRSDLQGVVLTLGGPGSGHGGT